MTDRGGTNATNRQPNFVVVLCDDLGYGDVEPYGGWIPTPAINRMAEEGLVATDYYAPANICTPSRAGLLTGRYPVRTGLGHEVIFPGEDRKLPLTEPTIARALKPDYACGFFGKWHLGHAGSDWLPTNYGFDTFFGIPYSHDMQPLSLYESHAGSGDPTRCEVDLPQLQQEFYAHAERFIEEYRNRPFFVELALSAPHLPEYPSEPFKGTSRAGPYGDVIREVDSIVGRLLDKLVELSLDKNTMVIFTSDNGPWYEGSSGPLRDRKGGTAYDGGFRVPFIVWAPGMITPATRTDAVMCGIDLLPTFCRLAGRELPEGVEIDGVDISSLFTSGSPLRDREVLLFNNEDVVGIRTQRWKYVTQTYYRGLKIDFERAGYNELYDMTQDISESYSVAESFPDETLRLQARIKQARQEFEPFKKGVPPFIRELMQRGAHRRQD
jgi:arylsulfatase A-like enzyme